MKLFHFRQYREVSGFKSVRSVILLNVFTLPGIQQNVSHLCQHTSYSSYDILSHQLYFKGKSHSYLSVAGGTVAKRSNPDSGNVPRDSFVCWIPGGRRLGTVSSTRLPPPPRGTNRTARWHRQKTNHALPWSSGNVGDRMMPENDHNWLYRA